MQVFYIYSLIIMYFEIKIHLELTRSPYMDSYFTASHTINLCKISPAIMAH